MALVGGLCVVGSVIISLFSPSISSCLSFINFFQYILNIRKCDNTQFTDIQSYIYSKAFSEGALITDLSVQESNIFSALSLLGSLQTKEHPLALPGTGSIRGGDGCMVAWLLRICEWTLIDCMPGSFAHWCMSGGFLWTEAWKCCIRAILDNCYQPASYSSQSMKVNICQPTGAV